VLQTMFSSAEGEIKLTDFMPVERLDACWYRRLDNNTWHQDDGSCHCLVRKVECIAGELPIIMKLKVTPNYATSPADICLMEQQGKAVVSGSGQHVGLIIVGAASASAFSMSAVQEETELHPSVIARATLREGERMLFLLGVGRTLQAAFRLIDTDLPRRNFEVELARTLSRWRAWISQCNYRGPYFNLVRRSALILKMLWPGFA
jgi:GH15 family glucan-1,4-alpha-glucosidase